MKKFILFLALFLTIVFPYRTSALSAKITETSMSGADSGIVGAYFQVRFNIIMSGLTKNTYNTCSLLAASFIIEIDPTILTITNIYPDVWDTKVYDLGNGKYYFISEFNENSSSSNSCIDNLGYCSNYSIPVTFHVSNTNLSSTTIKITEAAGGFIDLSGNLEEISDDDVITSEYKTTYSKTIKIEKTGSVEETKTPTSSVEISKEPAPSVENIQSKVTEEISNNSNTTQNNTKKEEKQETKEDTKNDSKKSKNTFLKTLNIKEYNIAFSKEKRNYDIYLDRSINSISVEAEVEDTKASLEIVGSDNLKDNGYKVLVNVKAEDGSVNTYTINVYDIKDRPKQTKKKKQSFYEKNKIKIIISGCVVVAFGLIILVLNFINNRKIDKALKF